MKPPTSLLLERPSLRISPAAPWGLLLLVLLAPPANSEEGSRSGLHRRREVTVTQTPKRDPRVSVTVNGAGGKSQLTIGRQELRRDPARVPAPPRRPPRKEPTREIPLELERTR